MTTLREARKKGKLDQFIREHEKDTPGDLDKLDAAIKRPARGSEKEAPKASSEASSDD
jgi:hypothetical protein